VAVSYLRVADDRRYANVMMSAMSHLDSVACIVDAGDNKIVLKDVEPITLFVIFGVRFPMMLELSISATCNMT
jgi:hypothetical protein